MTGITVKDSRFGRNTRHSDLANISTKSTTLTVSGSVWDDNGSPGPHPQRRVTPVLLEHKRSQAQAP